MVVETDLARQLRGVDRVVTLTSGREINVEEKVRQETYPDFALEYWSSFEDKARGWMVKSQLTDYLAYVFLPTCTSYMLPYQLLRTAWQTHRIEWTKKYFRIEANNTRPDGSKYTTVSRAVPIKVVLAAISESHKFESLK